MVALGRSEEPNLMGVLRGMSDYGMSYARTDKSRLFRDSSGERAYVLDRKNHLHAQTG